MPTPGETYTTVAEDLRRGAVIKRIGLDTKVYPRLHWWEENLQPLDRAMLDEQRALRAAIDVLIEKLGGSA